MTDSLNGNLNIGNNVYVDSSNIPRYITSGYAASIYSQGFITSGHVWYIAPTGTAGNAITLTAAMTLDANGRLGIGTTAPTQPLTVFDANNVADYVAACFSSNALGAGESRTWVSINKGGLGANFGGAIGGYLSQGVGGGLLFGTQNGTATPVERARITNTGFTIISSSIPGGGITTIDNSSNTSGTLVATLANRANANDTSSYYLVCQEPGVVNRCFIYGNGNLANLNNVYGAISDIKHKENIVDASSQWADFKNLQVRKYNLKESEGFQGHTQIGLIAQEAEQVCPGLVFETPDRDTDGNDLGTVTKSINYSILYMKAVKALQEAIERIETLEAKVAALEGN